MGPILLVASSVILAIRTARSLSTESTSAASPYLEREIEQSVSIAHRIFAHLLAKSPFLFPHKEVPIQETDGALSE